MPGLGNEGEDVELGSGKRRAKRYFPFAEGPRHCVGMSLANITLPATLAVLLSRFSFKLADEVRRPCSRGVYFWGGFVRKLNAAVALLVQAGGWGAALEHLLCCANRMWYQLVSPVSRARTWLIWGCAPCRRGYCLALVAAGI